MECRHIRVINDTEKKKKKLEAFEMSGAYGKDKLDRKENKRKLGIKNCK